MYLSPALAAGLVRRIYIGRLRFLLSGTLILCIVSDQFSHCINNILRRREQERRSLGNHSFKMWIQKITHNTFLFA